MSTLTVIIPAAGSGKRMGSNVPKPFITLKDKTVLEHTVASFNLPDVTRIIIATSTEYLSFVRGLFLKYDGQPEIVCVEGGTERYQSVANALEYVGDVDLVAVHDAARPFISARDIEACKSAAEKDGAAILAIKATDTVKRINESGRITSTLDRDSIWMAQTPQIFRKAIILDSYRKAAQSGKVFTDDSSIVESAGYPVTVVQGDVQNIKLTYPDDMERAKIIIEQLWKE